MAAFWRRLGPTGVALLLASLPGVAASPDPATLRVSAEDTARARALVRRLGSDIFRDRDDATRELAALGRRARAALEEARSDPDPEVSARVNHLLPRAALDEMGARVATFLADAEARYEHDIPGWPKFRVALGDDAASRDLFAELLADRANYDILTRLGGAPAALTPGLTALAGGTAALRVESAAPAGLRAAAAARRQILHSKMNPSQAERAEGTVPRWPSPAEFALILLAESDAPEPESPTYGTALSAAQHFYAPGVKESITGNHKHSAALRQLTWRWLDARVGPGMPPVAIGAHLQLDPARLADFAARTLRKLTPNAYDRVAAINAIGQAGGRAHLGALTAVFADERPYFNQANLGGFDIRVCDFALATALEATGQKPTDYGLSAHPAAKFLRRAGSNSYYFESDAAGTAGKKSQAAFEKWRAFEAAQLGSALGGPLGDRVSAARHPTREAKPDPKVIVVDD